MGVEDLIVCLPSELMMRDVDIPEGAFINMVMAL